jgi:hypothetical protein
MNFSKKGKEVVLIAAVLMAAAAAPTSAQPFGGSPTVITVYPSVTSDQATEQNTGIAALSLTATGGGGTYTSATSTIATLDQGLFSGVTAQNFNTTFSGWLACQTNCTAYAQQVDAIALQTYYAVLNDVAHNEQRLQNEDFSNISQDSLSQTQTLPVLRDIVDSNLQIVRELQFISHQLDVLNTERATADAEKKNDSAVTAAQDIWLLLTGLGVQN